VKKGKRDRGAPEKGSRPKGGLRESGGKRAGRPASRSKKTTALTKQHPTYLLPGKRGEAWPAQAQKDSLGRGLVHVANNFMGGKGRGGGEKGVRQATSRTDIEETERRGFKNGPSPCLCPRPIKTLKRSSNKTPGE